MTTWNKNAGVYQKWLDMHESDMETLKDMLCLQQFGYRVSHSKILWMPSNTTSYPIAIVPTVSQREIEEEALPQIFGKHKKFFVETWKEYEKTRDGSKLEYQAEVACCSLQ
ncbi:hypothetical protein [Brazilian marseillevirus]|uniref:hypothetical protein n=1 Tax=Brazilian marseillevirus TaxID=1813599 RepID=UPI0007851D2E|nr:hypothetical protein A3303_gp333 [Brazilian marseillevirus]AMQ10841.1 hypothetical protein [Brazilian marseillevirus]